MKPKLHFVISNYGSEDTKLILLKKIIKHFKFWTQKKFCLMRIRR